MKSLWRNYNVRENNLLYTVINIIAMFPGFPHHALGGDQDSGEKPSMCMW